MINYYAFEKVEEHQTQLIFFQNKEHKQYKGLKTK